MAINRSAVKAMLPLIPLAVLPFLTSSGPLLDLLVWIFIWSAVAIGWNLTGGFANMISLGHAAFFGIGAYTSTLLYLTWDVSPWVGAVMGALLATSLGVSIGVATLRLRGPFFVLATLAIGEVLRIAAIQWRGLTRGSEGLSIPYEPSLANMIFTERRSYAVLGWFLLSIGIAATTWVQHSRHGYYLKAVGGNEDAAATLGVNLMSAKLLGLGLGAAITSLAGTMYAQYILFIEPNALFGVPVSIEAAIIPIIGGLGTVWGPVLGAFLVVPVSHELRALFGGGLAGAHLLIYGFVLIIVVFFLPQGLLVFAQEKLSWARRRIRGDRAETMEDSSAS